MKKYNVNCTVNGIKRSFDTRAGDTLLEAMRGTLGIKSPKLGCDWGDCGACTVIMDGRTVRACLVLAVEADGAELTTLEGITQSGPTKLQSELVKRNAFQCGFCAPGMILSAEEVLKKHPHASREEIAHALAGNLCRCTGYEPVLDAIEAVAKGGK